jgi:hypothetical protein
MAGLDDIVRGAVSLVNSITSSLQVQVTLRRWKGDDMNGTPDYFDPETYTAVVEKKNQATKTKVTGQKVPQETLAKTYVVFVQPIPATAATPMPRRQPIDENDLIILPDGDTGPILNISGVLDPDTNACYASEVWLG